MTKPIINHDGTKEWRDEFRRLHREDGPAVEKSNGDKFWYINNNLHREDGPAAEFENGTKAWYLNGKRHRIDGPAIEYNNGPREFYFDNDQYPFLSWLRVSNNVHNKRVILKELLLKLKNIPKEGLSKKWAAEDICKIIDIIEKSGNNWPELNTIKKAAESL